MREVLVGFDSAWTDSVTSPGAIAAYVLDGGRCTSFHAPRLATFEKAAGFIAEVSADASYVLVAIDQPTIVPNLDGCRPVDRVAASLVSRLGGGVQPAKRGGRQARMFGDEAPIWRFLAAIDAVQAPTEAREAETGRFAMEVFPALALPAIVPGIMARRRAAKYNPASGKFSLADWQVVTAGLGLFARRLGAHTLADWAESAQTLAPCKADQDRVDAGICLAIALCWRFGPRDAQLLIGDEMSGYMATIVSPETRQILVSAAARSFVPVNRHWPAVAELVPGAGRASAPPSGTPEGRLQMEPAPSPRSVRPQVGRGSRVDQVWLRALLIERARVGEPISYGEVADRWGVAWNQGFGASLAAALNALGLENDRSGEPQLMCLVVNKTTRLPGQGFYRRIDCTTLDGEGQATRFRQELEKCRSWAWPLDDR